MAHTLGLMGTTRTAALLLVPVTALALTACTVTKTYSIAGPDLADKVAGGIKDAISATTAPPVDCGTNKITVEEGGTTTCTVTDDGGDVYDVTVTFYNLDTKTGKFDFRFEVAPTPHAK